VIGKQIMKTIRNSQWLFGLIATISFGAIQASAEAESAGVKESAGVFAGDVFTSLFGIAMFILLLVVLGKWAWKPILFALKRREEHIQKAIDDAEKARKDAEAALADYQQRLNQAKAESQAIIDQGRQDAHQLADEMKKRAQEEATSLRKQSARDITAAKDQALQEIYRQAVELTTDLASKVIRKNLNSEDQRQLVQEAISQMPRFGDEETH
jgi:F-type H+-transporting ATPase subunit b